MIKKPVSFGIITVLVLFGTIGFFIPHIEEVTAGSADHDAIFIDGNYGFNETNGVTNGSGTANDPYIIEDWTIEINDTNAIDIRHTTAYFTIRNVTIIGTNQFFSIYLYDVENGLIEKNYFNAHYWDIVIVNSRNIKIKDNPSCSIYLEESDNNEIFNNRCSVYLNNSNENNITDNDSLNVILEGSSNNQILSNNVSSSNTGIKPCNP